MKKILALILICFAINSYGVLSVTISALSQKCTPDTLFLKAVGASGTAPYTYAWSTGDVGSAITVTSLDYSLYQVTVTDNVGATATDTTYASATDSAVFKFATTNPSPCYNNLNGLIVITATGGTSPYVYHNKINDVMSILTRVNTFSALTGNVSYYTKTITAYGCPDTSSAAMIRFILGPSQLVLFAVTQDTASITLGASGGVPGYQYKMNSGSFQTSPKFTGLSTCSTANFVARDFKGCQSLTIQYQTAGCAYPVQTPMKVNKFFMH